MGLITATLLSSLLVAGPGSSHDFLQRWHECGLSLLSMAGPGVPEPSHYRILALFKRHSQDKSPDFLEHLLAVALIESGFQASAVSPAGARGLLQLTPPAVAEAAAACRWKIPTAAALHDPALNIRFGSCYLKMLLVSTEGDWDKALILYNGGIRQLIRYEQNRPIALETANYVLKVRRVLAKCHSSL